MKYLLSGGVGTERGVGARAYTPSLVRVERPCPHSRDSRYIAKRTARMHAHCARRRRADGRPAIPAVSLVPSARPFRFFPFECFFLFLVFNASFFPPAATLPRDYTQRQTQRWFIWLVHGDVRVIYRDLIAFNSSGATVNHKASRVARVSHACCRYDIITSINELCEQIAVAVNSIEGEVADSLRDNVLTYAPLYESGYTYSESRKYPNTCRRLLWIYYVCYSKHFEISLHITVRTVWLSWSYWWSLKVWRCV